MVIPTFGLIGLAMFFGHFVYSRKLNLVEFGMPVEAAVDSPRVHFESGLLNLEHGFAEDVLQALEREYERVKRWPEANLFFGGAHTVASRGGRFEGFGDRRRGGVCRTV